MEVKAELLNSANATLKTVIKAEELKNRINKLAKKASKNVKIDGFRKGKVPVSVVLKRYGKDLEDDAKNDIFRELINESLKILGKKSEDVMGDPMIIKFNEKDDNIDIEIEISFKPEVKINGFEEILPEFEMPIVEKEELDKNIEQLLKNTAPLEKAQKEILEKGDFAKFDFEGFIDNKAFEGGKAIDYVLEIGSGQFIPGFEDGMIGLKVGEEKEINVSFPQEYGAPNLAGKSAIFKIKLNEIQTRKNVVLDEQSVKILMPSEKELSVEKFIKKVEEQIKNEKFQKLLNEDLKPKFAQAVVDKFKFDLPRNIVEQEIDMQFRNNWNSFTEDEINEFKENKEVVQAKRESYRDEAINSVALTFIIDELAKQKHINATDNEIVQTIYFEAYKYGIDPKKHLQDYREKGLLPAIKMAIIEEKLFNNLFKKDESEKQ